MMTTYAVILAGGKGTRFWPQSRARRPKQLLPIVTERTMVQETARRLEPLVPPERIWVVTGGDHAAELREQLPEVPEEQIVVEPVGRNTAPAIGLAAALIEKQDPGAAMIVLPADHHILAPEAFRATLERALEVAASGEWLVTIGIEPTGPETGYGYIERGAPIGAVAFRVASFREKPDRARAQGFLTRGGFYWNSGIFVWTARAAGRAIAKHLPETATRLGEIVFSWGDGALLARGYPAIADQSIDYGVLEKADNVAVVPGDFGWDDIGSWSALGRLWSADEEGNSTRGRVIAIDSRNNVAVGGKRVIALVGVEKLCVVETDDAILVCDLDQVQDVKRVIDELRRRSWDELL